MFAVCVWFEMDQSVNAWLDAMLWKVCCVWIVGRCLHEIIHTGSSAVWYLHSFDNLSEYSDYILQFDIPVTAGPSWCLGSNHNNTRLAVSMGYVITGVMPAENYFICYCLA